MVHPYHERTRALRQVEERRRAERRFRDAEDEYWQELWPDPPQSFDVATHLGTTRAYRWPGDDAAHAGRLPARQRWHRARMVGATSRASADGSRSGSTPSAMPDAANRKSRSRTRPTTRQWLEETLAGLDVERAHLVGMSYGGFLALNQAARFPKRVASLTLLDPAGLGTDQARAVHRLGHVGDGRVAGCRARCEHVPPVACGCPRSKTIA